MSRSHRDGRSNGHGEADREALVVVARVAGLGWIVGRGRFCLLPLVQTLTAKVVRPHFSSRICRVSGPRQHVANSDQTCPLAAGLFFAVDMRKLVMLNESQFRQHQRGSFQWPAAPSSACFDE
jgi:hypothetical protein